MDKYDWMDVESEESLRDDYKLEEIASRVDEDLNLQGIIKFNSFKKMFMFICALRNFIDDYIKNKEGYFLSDKHKVAFMILNYNPIIKKEIGITRKHYLNKDLAREWKLKYIKMFHPDQGFVLKDQDKVVDAINRIYYEMVGEA